MTAPPAGAWAQATFPARPPAPTALRPVRFPPFVNARLQSGLDLIVVEHHEQPVVTVSLSVPAGSFHDPADKPGLAELVAEVITKGTPRRTADQIAEQVEGAGGSIGAAADADHLTITVSALAEHLAQVIEVLAEVATQATFPPPEVELARTRILSALQVALSQPEVVADRIFDREVYGEHPYGRSATPAGVRALTRGDVMRFHAERVKPAGSLLVVAGDVSADAVRQLAERAFAGWTGESAPAAQAAAGPARERTGIVLVHKPGATQSNVIAGFPFITPGDPAVYPLTVLNRVLGGGSDSRLFRVLREQKGWTYGAYSDFTQPRGVGAFAATVEVRTEATDSALAELIRQLELVRSRPVPAAELRGAISYLVGSFPRRIETPEQIAQQVASARLRGLPDDYVLRYRDRLAAVTGPAVQAAARRYLATDRMTVVVVGDGTRLHAPLAASLPVSIVDVEGRPLAEADLAPRATAAVPWAADRVTATSLSYRLLFQGNPLGGETRRLERDTEGAREVWRVFTATNLGPLGRQDDTVTIDAATLAPIRVRQEGTLQGQQVFTRLDYAEGRVRGQSRAPRPGGPRQSDIDTALTPGTLDDNQLAAVMVALPHAAGARWTFPVFSGGEAGIRMMTAAVTGEDSVTVPAGTFACWRVEVTGGQLPVTFFVSKDPPHTVVKLELQGAPLVFELTQRT